MGAAFLRARSVYDELNAQANEKKEQHEKKRMERAASEKKKADKEEVERQKKRHAIQHAIQQSTASFG